MSRAVPEWIGRTDDAAIPASVKLRILERQNNVCALTSLPFTIKDPAEFDHRTPLWLGGEHRENNIHAILASVHKPKTKAEAKVRAKVNRIRVKTAGIRKPSKFATGRDGPFKQTIGGKIVRRDAK